MKRAEILRQLKAIAQAKNQELIEVREGRNHTIYRIGSKLIPVGRHTEIPENTARKIIKQAEQAETKEGDE